MANTFYRLFSWMVFLVSGMNAALAEETNQASTVPSLSEAYHAIAKDYQESLDRMVRAEAPAKECYQLRIKRDKALTELIARGQTLDTDTLNSADLTTLAAANELIRDWDQAAVVAEQALALDRTNLACYPILVRSLLNLGRQQEAEQQIDAGVVHCGHNVTLCGLKMMCHLKCAQLKDHDGAYRNIAACYDMYAKLLPEQGASAARATVHLDTFIKAAQQAGQQTALNQTLHALLEGAQQQLENAKQASQETSASGASEAFLLYCLIYELSKHCDQANVPHLQETWLQLVVDQVCNDPNEEHVRQLEVFVVRTADDIQLSPQTISTAVARLEQVEDATTGQYLNLVLARWQKTRGS